MLKWVAALVFLWQQVPALAQDTAAGGRNPGAPRYSEVVRQSLYVPVRDGTRLAVNLYRPAVAGQAVADPHPVVFVFTPYRARYRSTDGTVAEAGLSPRLGLQGLTDHGYVVAVADIRGKGASFGARRGFQDRTEARDGHDLVQWLAGQPWSTGRVGMVGCSYLGGTTLQVASTAPPALRAVFTGASDLDKYQFVRRGGITAQFNTRPDEPLSDDLQSLPVDADADGSLLRAAVAEHAANTPMAALWYGMPYRDSVSSLTGNRFWEEVGPYTYLEELRRSGIATYFWGNWEDEPTEQMVLATANLGGRLLVGPGSHCVPPPDFDLAGEIRRFFDHQLKGVDNGFEREPPYLYWMEDASGGSHRWVRSDQLPGAGVSRSPLYLAGAGSLREDIPEPQVDHFTVDYDVGATEYFAFWPKSLAGKGLSYEGPELRSDRVMLGFPILHLWLAADRRDANVFAYLEDVAPDGTAIVISHGRLRASHRQLSIAPYDTLGLPWHSGLAADALALEPGEPAELVIPMLPNTRVFRAGHRLRVTITGADPRQRNLQELREDPPARLSVSGGAAMPSRIEIPWLPGRPERN